MAENINTFASYSGSDIHAVFGSTIFGQIQMISYKQDREKAPVYTMGSPDLRTIARGKRLITGACVFVVFDKDALLEAMNLENGKEKRPFISKDELAQRNGGGVFDEAAKSGGTASVLSDVADSTYLADDKIILKYFAQISEPKVKTAVAALLKSLSENQSF